MVISFFPFSVFAAKVISIPRNAVGLGPTVRVGDHNVSSKLPYELGLLSVSLFWVLIRRFFILSSLRSTVFRRESAI